MLLQAQKLRKQLRTWQSCAQHTALRSASAAARRIVRSLTQSLRAWRVRGSLLQGHTVLLCTLPYVSKVPHVEKCRGQLHAALSASILK